MVNERYDWPLFLNELLVTSQKRKAHSRMTRSYLTPGESEVGIGSSNISGQDHPNVARLEMAERLAISVTLGL